MKATFGTGASSTATSPVPSPALPAGPTITELVKDLKVYVDTDRCRRFNERGENGPFEFGALAAIWCPDPTPRVGQVSLFRFDSDASMDAYWDWRVARMKPRPSRLAGACADGSQGVDRWAHGEFACYVSDADKRAKLRWSDERTNSYGVIDASHGGARGLFQAWLELVPTVRRAGRGPGVPLVTAKATAKPTPRPTPRPTPKSDWNNRTYKVAQRYLESARQTYASDLPRYAYPLRNFDWSGPGLTGMERAVRRHEGNLHRDHALTVLQKHKRFMNRNAPAKCFEDAYAADRRIANRWIKQLKTGRYGSPYTANGRAINFEYDKLDRATDTFTSRLANRYFMDCR